MKVLLPSLRNLNVDMVGFGNDGQRFYNLLSGCPLIEELEMKDIACDITVHDDTAADYKALDFVSLVEAEVLHLRGEEVEGEDELEMT
ncbi:hypothetical protein DY000_02056361 [Brassica cretica]|uniref:FBD domain-containing protein n=1 Tax=Brassica cretica TaxID=69181 RepID=A0ABQ7AAF2_BRACR|nr:hypothetical protein DY000_02056361 [Brassica cretica]